MTKDQILARAEELRALCVGHVDQRADSQHVLTGALTLMNAVYGEGSQQVKALLSRRDEIAKMEAIVRVKKILLTDAVQGVLANLEQEVSAGLLSSVERRVTSDVLSDLIKLARIALDEGTDGAKNVAAVLAAAAFEDALRRIAKEYAGVIGQDSLADVLTALKAEGIIVAPQLGIAQSYLNFRNRDRKSTRLNSSHGYISYAVFCLKKKKNNPYRHYNIIRQTLYELFTLL